MKALLKNIAGMDMSGVPIEIRRKLRKAESNRFPVTIDCVACEVDGEFEHDFHDITLADGTEIQALSGFHLQRILEPAAPAYGFPTAPGWYWRRSPAHFGQAKFEIDVVHVRDYAGSLAIGNSTIGNWKEAHTWEWFGPLPYPSWPEKT